MIDSHCHLEQPDYNRDRDTVIKKCKRHLQAVVTCCANPENFDVTMQIVREHRGFIFACASLHPRYIKEVTENGLNEYIAAIRSQSKRLVAIGETGLDYNWIKDSEGKEKQKLLFVKLIALAEQLQLPLVVHSRKATEDAINILEERKAKDVQMHMFTTRSMLNRVIENGWLISVNTLLLKSKSVKKIVRDCPLEQMMLETDSPWLGIGEDGNIKPKNIVRNDPTAIRLVAEKIAEIKGMSLEAVDNQTTHNATQFFNIHF
jgi:TatD DNase family protein